MDQALNLAAALSDMVVRPEYMDYFYQGTFGGRGKAFQEALKTQGTGFSANQARPFKARKERSYPSKKPEKPGNQLEEDFVGRYAFLLSLASDAFAKEQESSLPLSYGELDQELRSWLKSQDVGKKQLDVWKGQFGADLTLVEALQAQLIDKYDDAMTDEYNMSYLLMGKERRQKSPQFVMYRAADPSLGDPLSIQVACSACKRIRQDRAPYWMKDDGRYVLKTSNCRQCPRKKNQIVATIHYPVNKSVKTISKDNVVKKYWAAYPDAPGADKYREKQREKRLSGIA